MSGGYDIAEKRRAHLLATLRAAPGPLSTSELHDSCPPEIVRHDLSYRCPCRLESNPRAPIVACHHGWVEYSHPPAQTNVYANLRQLERAGLIESMRPGDTRSVYWQAVLSPAEAYRIGAEIEQLERMWSA